MPEKIKPYTVTAVTRMIKTALEESFFDLWVEGEISNYIHHSSGHRYMYLKDENAVIKVTIWRSVGTALKFEPENGQKVIVFGNITVYEKGGNYQLNCRKLVPVGVGELELAFRQLHEKLSAEGLFDEDRKRPLPEYPLKIGIVTSPTGAAVRDIIQIARRRNDSVELIIYPAQVQGDGAELTIKAGIEYFNRRDDIDVIITGRGGGSLEDLWPFNTEIVVRAVATSKIPVVSAVGHEIDITLSDLAADLRAPTPSAASELVIWSKRELRELIEHRLTFQARQLNNLVQYARQQLVSILQRPVFARPLDMIRQQQQYLDSLMRLLQAAGKNRFDVFKNKLSLLLSRLEALSPLKILNRGYSVSRKPADLSLIKSCKDIDPGELMETVLADGRLVSMVKERKTE
ncbi:MAG: exodeoxyribonuclease VII large subunit [candidate division Zixibacteria bacterium]|nr:exodeoxyribonuclease VII large subunit [candidate division Zixibacteria bacterium]